MGRFSLRRFSLGATRTPLGGRGGGALLLALLLAVGVLAASASSSIGAKPPLYPDLRPEPARDLEFGTEEFDDGPHRVLRLTAVVRNVGRGRLELEGDPSAAKGAGARTVYQNVYAGPTGGRLVDHRPIALDILYHPTHEHFHLQDFAAYQLLRQDKSGTYEPIPANASKVSFCVRDDERRSGAFAARYQACNLRLQGLTPGWADVYDSKLADQWIDLGPDEGRAAPLEDGEYALRITADPKNKISEGGRSGNGNNASLACFSVAGGAITLKPCE